jgi:hypothetical protein
VHAQNGAGLNHRGDDGEARKASVAERRQPSKPESKSEQAYVPWRKRLPIHPAADKYPLLDQRELLEVGDDIKRNGLKYRAVVTPDGSQLCDGRSRLDAMEPLGTSLAAMAVQGTRLLNRLNLGKETGALNLRAVPMIEQREPRRAAGLSASERTDAQQDERHPHDA